MRRRGFTLVEVAVGLGITALALLGLGQLLKDSAGMQRRLDTGVARETEVEGMFQIVELLLASVEYEQADSTRQAVSGGRNRIAIVSRGPPILSLVSATAFELVVDAGPSAGDRSIVLSWQSSSPRQREVLASGLGTFALLYGERSEGAIVWREAWDQPVRDLAAIRIDVSEAGELPTRSRVFRVQPLLSSRCALAPLTAGCPEWR